MDDAWNEKIPAQCTRNTKRVLQPALWCTVLWVVCSLGRGVCIFWKAPSLQDMYKSKQKTEWKMKKDKYPLTPRSTYSIRLVLCFLHLPFQHPWAAKFCMCGADSPHLRSAVHKCITLCCRKNGAKSLPSLSCVSLPGPRMAWDKSKKKILSGLTWSHPHASHEIVSHVLLKK